MPTPSNDVRVWHDLGKELSRAYEWFYFDLIETDGTQMSISLLAPNPFDLTPYRDTPTGPRCAQCAPPNYPAPSRHVAAVVHASVPGEPPNVRSVQQAVHVNDGDGTVSFKADPWELRIAGATVTRTNDPLPVYTVDFDVAVGPFHAKGNLTFKTIQPEWAVPDDGLLFKQQTDIGHWHRWVVHAPRAVVNGEYEITALVPTLPLLRKRVVNGDGYHDHNWGTRRPADAFQRWMWARGSAGENAVVAASLVPNPLVGYTDLRVSSLFAVTRPTGVSASLFTVTPDEASSELPFAKVIDVGLSPSAGAYRAVFRHERVALEFAPFYQRRITTLELFDPGAVAPVQGLAVAETMLPQIVG